MIMMLSGVKGQASLNLLMCQYASSQPQQVSELAARRGENQEAWEHSRVYLR